MVLAVAAGVGVLWVLALPHNPPCCYDDEASTAYNAWLIAQHGRDVTAILLAAEILNNEGIERQARKHHDPVITLLSIEGDVLIAEPLESLARKFVVRALGLLQAQHIRADRLDEFRHQIDAQAHRIDVPG